MSVCGDYGSNMEASKNQQQFASPEENAKLKELHAAMGDFRLPVSERGWAKSKYEELSTVIARRAVAWLDESEPAAVSNAVSPLEK